MGWKVRCEALTGRKAGKKEKKEKEEACDNRMPLEMYDFIPGTL